MKIEATSAAQHQLECEARYLLKMPKDRRTTQYERILKARGRDALAALIAEVKRQHEGQR